MLMRFLLLLMLLTWMTVSDVHAQVGISPRTLDVVLDEDGRSHSIRLFNLSEKPFKVAVSVDHWTLNENNEVEIIPSTPTSLDQWMIVNPLNFEIPPGESQAIRIGFRPQTELAEGEYRAMLYFEQQLPPDDKPDVKQIRSRFRIGAAVYAHVGAVDAVAQIEQVSVQGKQVAVDIVNTGNTHVRLDGQWSIWPADIYPGAEVTHQIVGLGRDAAQIPEGVVSAGFLPRNPVLPGHQRRIVFELEDLPPQAQSLVLDMDAQFADKALDRAESFYWAGHENNGP